MAIKTLQGGVIGVAQYDNNKGLTLFEAIKALNERKLILPSEELLRQRLLTDTWKGEMEYYPAWVGPLTAYEESDKKLSTKIVYIDPKTGHSYTFPVIQKFQGNRRGTILVPHGFIDGEPTFDIKECGNGYVFMLSAKLKVGEDIIFSPLCPGGLGGEPGPSYAKNYVGLSIRGDHLLTLARPPFSRADLHRSHRFGVLALESASRAAIQIHDISHICPIDVLIKSGAAEKLATPPALNLNR
ncbi:MAG: hypothetical protein ABIH99_03025, partial [Candidatus Micrarchaeota archaeon]